MTLLFKVSLDDLIGRTATASDSMMRECAEHNVLTPEQEQMLLEQCNQIA